MPKPQQKGTLMVSKALRPLTDVELAHALSNRPEVTDIDPMSCIDVSMIIEVCV
jgi:hypothetical protein